jgi:hypothetical protein
MSRPWSPPSLNFTGTELPALTVFTTFSAAPGLSTGWKKPVKLYWG